MVVFLIVKVAQRIVCRRAEQDREVVRGVKSGACQLLARDQDGARCRHVRHRVERIQAVLPASICAITHALPMAQHAIIIHIIRREIQRLHSALPEHIFASIPIVASQTVRRAVAPKQLNSPRRQQSVAHSARFCKMGNA